MSSPAEAEIRATLRAAKQASPPASIEEARAWLDMMFGQYPLPPETRVETVVANGVPAEWVGAGGIDPERVILYLHGGAYTRGSLTSHRGLAARLSAASGARTLVIAYRLAPEHPFPSAVEDATTAYRWLLGNGISPDGMVIAGDSAGGGLAIATLLSLRDAGETLPAGAVLLSPWTDLAGTGASLVTHADADPWLTPQRLAATAALYLAGANPRNPLASPLYGDLQALPPLLIQVGSDEILLDDATRLTERAEAAGVSVTLEVWEEMWHVFQAFATEVHEGQQAIETIGAFIRQQIEFARPRALTPAHRPPA